MIEDNDRWMETHQRKRMVMKKSFKVDNAYLNKVIANFTILANPNLRKQVEGIMTCESYCVR